LPDGLLDCLSVLKQIGKGRGQENAIGHGVFLRATCNWESLSPCTSGGVRKFVPE
jgi:hypothetical protein